MRPSPLRLLEPSRSDKMSGVVEMLNRHFSPFNISLSLIAWRKELSQEEISKGQSFLKKKKITLLPKIDRSKFDQQLQSILLTFWKIHEFLLIYYEYFTRNVESKSTLCLLFIRTKSYPRIFDAWITIDGINGKIDDRWLALNENVKGRFASPRPRVRFKSLSFFDRDIERINDKEAMCLSAEQIDD